MKTEDLDSIFNSFIEEEGERTVASGQGIATPCPARLAFVDLNFSWPPNGGADTDLYNVVAGLQERGHSVHLFVVHEAGSLERGVVDPARLPFPATRLEFTGRTLTPEAITSACRSAVDAWRPDIVFIQHGYALKPYVLEALAHHRTVSRYYAHELACARDPMRFKDGQPCPHDFLRSPDICRRCALEMQKDAIRNWRYRTWTADYLAARAYAPEYHAKVTEALRKTDAIIVSNASMKAHLEGFHDRVHIFPGGVHADAIAAQPPPERDGPKIILMAGRADDPLKGLAVLMEAGARLAKKRRDFEIYATHFDHTLSSGWFKALGWKDHAGALALYGGADICVVPSLWEEPFGLVAVEAMAAGRPVCASRVGGLREIVRHAETGFLFDRGDSVELAGQLDRLLDSSSLRARMGQAGRRVVEQYYDWQGIIERHYVPFIERLLA